MPTPQSLLRSSEEHPPLHSIADALRHAFPARRPLLPWRERTAVPQDQWHAIWDEKMADTSGSSRAPRVLYVHVPFCANHCLFCGFYKNKLRPDSTEPYTNRLLREMELGLTLPRTSAFPIDAVYLGGGTPSALKAEDLSRIIRFIRNNFPLANDCEFTLEGRILHFDDERVDASIEAGINRISIGVQSFNTTVRQQQGRNADRESAIRFVEKLVARGTATVVIDLMFGLPNQDAEVWRNDVETALGIGPDGVDLYALNVFPGTPLFTAVQRGSLPPPPSLDQRGPLYDIGIQLMEDAGWAQVSNSHFSQSPRERNRYNMLIKGGAETLAFGSGGGGSIGSYSYSVEGELALWEEQVEVGKKPLSSMSQGDVHEEFRHALTHGLEVGRINIEDFKTRFPQYGNSWALVEERLEEWERAYLLNRRSTFAALTTAGRFWSTNLRGEILDLLVPQPPSTGKRPS